MGKRVTIRPWCGYKSPITGEMVRYHEDTDAEMLLLQERIQAGEDVGLGQEALARLQELNHQNLQNGLRIQKRMLGDGGGGGTPEPVFIVGPKAKAQVVTRAQQASEDYQWDRGRGEYGAEGDDYHEDDA